MVRELDFVDECYKDKDLSLLKKLTLIIPTYNRNNYLSRCLWYHAHFPFGRIIVADSSFEGKKIGNQEIIKNINESFGANILYLEYQSETDEYGGDIYRKWGDAVLHVKTEYSIICIDKAFQNIDPLIEKIEFLDENLDYVSAQGIWYHANVTADGKIVYYVPLDFHEPISADSEDRFQRFTQGSNQKWNNKLFALIRSPTHKLIYQPILNGEIRDIRYGEIALSLLPLIWGKHKYFSNSIDLIRDVSSVDTKHGCNKSESSSLRYPSRMAYYKIGVLDRFYSIFQRELIKQYNNADSGLSLQSNEDIKRVLMNAYYTPVRHPKLDPISLVLRTKWLLNFWHRMPKKWKDMFRSALVSDKNEIQLTKSLFTDICTHLILVQRH